jgi:hypothetical protein
MMLPPVQEKTELIEVVRITDPMRHLSAPNLVGDDIAIWEAAQVSGALMLISSALIPPRQRPERVSNELR